MITLKLSKKKNVEKLPKSKARIATRLVKPKLGPMIAAFNASKYRGFELGGIYWRITKYIESGFTQSTEDLGLWSTKKEALQFIDEEQPNKELQYFQYGVSMEPVIIRRLRKE